MTDSSTDVDQQYSDVERAVIAALADADGAPDWNDLQAAVGSDVDEDELEGAVETLQAEYILQHSGRRGGYLLVEDRDRVP